MFAEAPTRMHTPFEKMLVKREWYAKGLITIVSLGKWEWYIKG